jgi:hypothetical protein
MLMTVRREDRTSNRCVPSAARKPLRAGVAVLLLVLQLAGCFRYVPVGTVEPGSLITLEINDRGRVALEDELGPGVLAITGQVREIADERYVMATHSVEFADITAPVRIERERVIVERAHVAQVRERQLARTRTIITAVIVVIALVATSLITISGFGGDDDGGRNDPPGGGDPT